MAQFLGRCAAIAALRVEGRSGRHDVLDTHRGEILTMAFLAARVLPASLLERDELGPARVLDKLRDHLGPRYFWLTARHALAFADHQDLSKLDGRARLARDLLDLKDV